VTINNLFDMETFSFKGETNHVSLHGAFYQQIARKLIKAVYNTEAVTSEANRLIALADHALNLKQTDNVEQISNILAHAPLPHGYHRIGHYYQVFCLKRRGKIDQARAGFQHLAESPDLPLNFRARAIQALGVSYAETGHFDEAARFFIQAARTASARQGGDLLTLYNAQALMAVHRSVNGDHQGALLHLESLRPLVRRLIADQPLMRYIYINSLAVELGEVGRLEEARRLSEIALRSPYASLYPEWQETYTDIQEKTRGASPFVVAGAAWPQEASPAPAPAAHNVIAMPIAARPPASLGAAQAQPGRVIAYHGWRQPLSQPTEASPDTFTAEDLNRMSIHDKQAALLSVIYSDDVTHDTLDPLLVAAGKVMASDAPAS
jgi:tetratricopeptide (TPR) repeat protein